MAATILDTISIQLETVRPTLEKIFEQSDQISGKVKKSTKAQQISRYLYRMPFVQYAGGNFSKFSGNGGSLGTGTSLKTSNLVAGYFYSVLGYRLNQEQIDTSQNSSQAITNVLTYTLANAMEESKVLDDISFHQSGTGILTNGCSAAVQTNPSSMTFASATDFLGIARLREGMVVDVWDSAGANKRTYTAPLIIVNIDYSSNVVTFNQAISDVVATDIVSFQGLTAYGPTTLTSFASSYPGTVGAAAGGIGGDSFRHGFPYMTDATSSNYFYGIQKSSVSQLLPVRVNASSQPLEWDFVQRLIAKVMRKRDGDMWRNLVGIAPFAQRAAVFNLGMAISTKFISGNTLGKSIDLIPDNTGYSDVFDMAGIPCYISKRQDQSRIDFINFQKIERAQLFDTRYHDLGRGSYMYEGRGSDGTVQAFVEFFIEQAYDFVCVDGGAFGAIDTLQLPPNWDA